MKRTLTMFLACIFALSMIMPAAAQPSAEEGSIYVVAENEIFVVSEDASFDQLTISPDAAVVAADGYSLVMISEGEVVSPEPGDYTDVYLSLQPVDYTFGIYDETGNEEGYTRRYLYKNNPEEPVFIEEAFGDVSLSEEDGWIVFDGIAIYYAWTEGTG